jgi:hypothetical protein
MIIGVIPRVKDVLFALAAAGEHGQLLGRLPLQKIIYLADILAPIWREISKPAKFKPYYNGPYDLHIQNTVDALAFRGFVTVSDTAFRQITTIECRYSLTRDGSIMVKQLAAGHLFEDDFALFQEIATEVDRRGWHNIKLLVYAEPTYDAARIGENPGKIRTESPTMNLSRFFLRGFRESLRSFDGGEISRRNLIQLFFSVLSRHISIKEKNRIEGAV